MENSIIGRGGGVQKFERKKSAKIWREKVQKNWGNKRKKV